nr:hypothetical protein [Tanacetum cinerariifolium]
MDSIHCGSQMIKNHSKDRSVKEMLMMVLVMHTKEDDTVFHIEKTGMLMLVVEIDVGGMTADVVDKLTCSSDDVQPRQVDLGYKLAPLRKESVQELRDMYDSWKSRMELYMLNRQHKQVILESVESGPLLWPTIKENGVTRLKKYYESSTTEAIQADCDVKATNIILQGLPPEVYALVSTHKVAKELWERIKMLMQGT